MTVKLLEGASMEQLKKLNESFNVKIVRENILGFIDLKLPEDSQFDKIYEEYEKSGLFEVVEINSFGTTFGTDPGYANQYYLHNTGGYPDINATEYELWSIENGSSNPVVVAVLDLGVDYRNTDINMWENLGWNYVDDPNDQFPLPLDDDNHGTGVAGFIAAQTYNSKAGAGVAGGYDSQSGAKIMALRIGGTVPQPGYPGFEIVIYNQFVDDAIIYAASNGAKILNMSFGVDENASINSAINYAYDKGCLLIAATGNDNKVNYFGYPASNEKVLAVGGIRKYWGWYGNWDGPLEVVAPATQLYSTLNNPNELQEPPFGLWGDGTSGSAPQVAGIAALLWSKYPTLLNFDIRNVINESALDIGNPTHFANGLVKGDRAFMYANPNPNNPYMPDRPSISISAPVGGHPTISWQGVTTSPSVAIYGIYRADYEDGRRRHNFVMIYDVFHDGSQTHYWTDNSITVVNPRFATSTHYYRVTSATSQLVQSITSNEVSCGSNWLSKEAFQDDNIINEYKLYNNYPNPFNPSTVITYSLKKNERVSIKIYDVLGRIVSTLVNEIKPEGRHKVHFDAQNIPSGIYFYTIKTEGFTDTKKMILLR